MEKVLVSSSASVNTRSNEIRDNDNPTTTNTPSPILTSTVTGSVSTDETVVVVVEEATTRRAGVIHPNQSSTKDQTTEVVAEQKQKIDPPPPPSTLVQTLQFSIGRESVGETGSGTGEGIAVLDKDGGDTVPIPKFRLEGSGGGDSSIRVAVPSLATAVPPLTNSSPSVPVGDVPTGVDGPGSDSAPLSAVSVQSSEDMKLSLVSWYSEPDDDSRLTGHSSSTTSCCGGHTASIPINLEAHFQATSTKTLSDEKENKRPERMTPSSSSPQQSNCRDANSTFPQGDSTSVSDINERRKAAGKSPSCQRIKMHVQLSEEVIGTPNDQTKCSINCKHEGPSCNSGKRKPECPRCSRRSKSGSTTPATGSSRMVGNRRIIQSSKSSTELKKPMKSILKSDSRGSAGSGSDNKSSMDSLGSSEMENKPLRQRGTIMTRSEGGARAKFNLDHQIYKDAPMYSPEDKMVSKLKRIEKYATLRLRKTPKVTPVDLSDSDSRSTSAVPTDLMTKSMSFLEKTSLPGESHGNSGGGSLSANSTLKRQGSLRVKKSPSVWEPCTTRTTALRLQKMQEAKQAKSGTTGYFTGSRHSVGTNSGSGDSMSHLLHYTPTSSHHRGGGVHTASASKSHSAILKEKAQHVGAKVFSKLSSAMGQTASSNQKRLKQDKANQTETALFPASSQSVAFERDPLRKSSLSPIPSVDSGTDVADQVRQLQKLANRYRHTALRFQSEYEKAEANKLELTKQLLETQAESNEMIEFLQAEKSTLVESLAEIESEGKKWRDKEEGLSSKVLMDGIEAEGTAAVIAQLTSQIRKGTSSVERTREKVESLTNSLLKVYKVPTELLALTAESTNVKSGLGLSEAEIGSSLLLPLIMALATAFPLSTSHNHSRKEVKDASHATSNVSKGDVQAGDETLESISNPLTPSPSNLSQNQGFLDGGDDVTLAHHSQKDEMLLRKEISELNGAIGKLILVIRVIVIHCEKKVVTVASSILQCLNSMEDESVGNIPEIARVQKSLQEWQNGNSSRRVPQ